MANLSGLHVHLVLRVLQQYSLIPDFDIHLIQYITYFIQYTTTKHQPTVPREAYVLVGSDT